MPTTYSDGRPAAAFRLPAQDQGVVLKHGTCPNDCDTLGARDVVVYQSGSTYVMAYDGAGPTGWLASIATSTDLANWTKLGAELTLGAPGEQDSGSASYGDAYFDGSMWHMYYLGTPNTSPPPDRVPGFPYLTMKAKSTSPTGPWTKEPNVIPFRPTPSTYYSVTASPGQVVKQGESYLQFFSSTGVQNGVNLRTISIARTANLDGSWQPDPSPALPMTEQVENTSTYYQASTGTWFMFTNHVGITNDGLEYTEAIWVYWTQDINHWDAKNKAVVVDASTSTWSKAIIGLPSVMQVGNRLAVFYDGLQGNTIPPGADSNMNRDVGLAWVSLPIKTP